MLQYLGHRIGCEVGIQRHRHMPGHPDRQVADDPVRGVLADDCDVTSRGQLALAQPLGGATGLLADLEPAQRLHLPSGTGLNQKTLQGMTSLALVEHLQRQTKSSSHDSLLCFYSVRDTNQALARSTIPRTKEGCKPRNVAPRNRVSATLTDLRRPGTAWPPGRSSGA